MKRILFFMLALVLLLAACSPKPTATPVATLPVTEEALLTPTEEPLAEGAILVNDALGREVILPAAPQRIIITGKGLIMVADAVYAFPGAADKVIGLGNAAQGAVNFLALLDPAFTEKATLTNDATAEQIAAQSPDLLILKSSVAERLGPSLDALGIPVIYVDFETPEQYARDLAILGKIFENEARATELIAFYHDKADEIATTVAEATKPRVLLLSYSEKDGTVAFNVPPLGWMQTLMVEMAGGDPAWKDATLGFNWTTVTLEQIAAWDADKIFIVTYAQDPTEIVTTLKADPSWQALRAVQTNGLYGFAGDIYSWDQPDPRWILGLSWMASRLHPDLLVRHGRGLL
jgi:iron complex transport system substrate-binding protein